MYHTMVACTGEDMARHPKVVRPIVPGSRDRFTDRKATKSPINIAQMRHAYFVQLVFSRCTLYGRLCAFRVAGSLTDVYNYR